MLYMKQCNKQRKLNIERLKHKADSGRGLMASVWSLPIPLLEAVNCSKLHEKYCLR